MDQEGQYFHLGDSIDRESISSEILKGLITAIDKNPFVNLLDVQKVGSREALVIAVDVEIPQNPPVPIKRTERIAIVSSPDENTAPLILALRKDFPNTPHQNLVNFSEPKSICLFDEPFSEVKLRLNSVMFLQRVMDWLSRAAIEELHLSDQPIEPLLLCNERLIFDPKIFLSPGENDSYVLRRHSDNPLVLKVYKVDALPTDEKGHGEISHLLLPIIVPPWHLRLIEYRPSSFIDLGILLEKLGVNLQELTIQFIKNISLSAKWSEQQNFQIIILLYLQKTRIENGPVEDQEFWAFLIAEKIGDLAIKLGIMARNEGKLGVLLGQPISKDLELTHVFPLKPTFVLTKEFARTLSGLNQFDPRIMCIGAGALGSQVIINLARQGFGKWHIVDNDILLPHNLSRHSLSFLYGELNKANGVALEVNGLLNSDKSAEAYSVDILQEIKIESSSLHQTMAECDLIADFSTSRAVSRMLAFLDNPTGVITSFITSNGQYLVILSEGNGRKVHLDDLEAQFLSTVIDTPELSAIFAGDTNKTIYSGSCRDASVELPQDTVSIFSALVSKFIKNTSFHNAPCIYVWKLDNNRMTLSTYELPVQEVKIFKSNEWDIHVLPKVISEMEKNRSAHFPNETGGVLIGTLDFVHRVAYVTNVLPSPEDSIEWPNSYVRGVKGLREQVERIKVTTGNDLYYVGEWHSHPYGFSSQPSPEDEKAFKILSVEMANEGLPGIMLIKGDDSSPYLLFDFE